MKLNRNILIALQILIDNGGTLTGLDLKNALQISKSAALSVLTDCVFWLNDAQIQCREKVKRKSIVIPSDEIKTLCGTLEGLTFSDYDFAKLERRKYLLLKLLENRYLINEQICGVFGISRNTCIADISSTTRFFEENGFALRVESSNQGYALRGEELEIRRLILCCISMIDENYEAAGCRVNENYFFGLFGLNYKRIYDRAESLMSTASFLNIELCLQSAVYISACLELILRRISNCNSLKMKEKSLLLAKTHSRRNVPRLLKHSGIWQEVLSAISKLPEITEEERREILTSEWEILQQMIICVGSIWEDELETLVMDEVTAVDYSEWLVNAFEQRMASGFSTREQVVSDIAHTLNGILLRHRYRFTVRNSFYERIREEYRYVYDFLRQICEIRSFPGISFTESELLCLTAQFAGWMMRGDANAPDKLEQRKKIGIVCVNNIGVGALLQRQIQNIFPDTETKLIPLSDFNSVGFRSDADFIITTVTLKASGTTPVVRVNALLSSQDKDRIFARMYGRHSKQEAPQKLIKDTMEIIKDFISLEQKALLANRLERLFNGPEYQIMYSEVKQHMLKDLITADRIQIIEKAENWKEALRIASKPLLKDGSITESYVDAMIGLVEKMGPYIVLAPGIALPHARKEDGVNRLAMSLLCCREKVYFNEEKYANLFFVLASDDGRSHIDALMHLSKIFSNESKLDQFLKAKSVEELAEMIASDK